MLRQPIFFFEKLGITFEKREKRESSQFLEYFMAISTRFR